MEAGDILDAEAIHRVVAEADLVYHLAGLADLDLATTSPLETARQNVLGTVNVLEAARESAIERLLFASTAYVYSRAGGFYRCSKQACESYVEEYQRQWGVPYTILRYGSLYGPRADETNGVFRLLEQAVSTGKIRHLGSAEDSREYVHVEDAARLSVDVLEPRFENQPVTITGQHPMRLRDLFTMFSEVLGRSLDVEYVEPDRPFEDTHYRVTPYAFTPRVGRKLTSNYYVDMGQGVLQMLEQMQQQKDRPGT